MPLKEHGKSKKLTWIKNIKASGMECEWIPLIITHVQHDITHPGLEAYVLHAKSVIL